MKSRLAGRWENAVEGVKVADFKETNSPEASVQQLQGRFGLFDTLNLKV